jgi:hypothetical protein
MNKSFPILSIMVAVVLFAAAYGALVVQAHPAIQAQVAEKALPKAVTYEGVLGKSLNDKDVADFIVSNHCSGNGAFQLCKNAGMALWTDKGQTVKSVYLYPTSVNGFAAYKGALPFGLAANDTMATIEQKFGQPKVIHAPQAGWEPGLPDEAGSPDYIHYWAIYKRFGVTVIYNSPSANDRNATVNAILINK